MSYDLATLTGKTRLLAADTSTTDPVFSDDEIDAFLAMSGSEPLYAAALALDTMAASEALTLKRITLLDLQTDGQATAAALRAQAQELREVARSGVGNEADLFAVAEMILNPATARERMLELAKRELL
jgi:hypothetical protein